MKKRIYQAMVDLGVIDQVAPEDAVMGLLLGLVAVAVAVVGYTLAIVLNGWS